MIQFNFETIRTRIRNRLAASTEWKEILYHSTNQRLIDAIALELAFQASYTERGLIESKWGKAQNKSSLLLQAPFIDYFPHRKIGSYGNLVISTSETFDATYSEDIIIPKWSIFSNGGDIKFTNPTAYNFRKTQTNLTIEVVQGTPLTKSYTASGNLFESVIVDNANIEDNYFECFVNGEAFTEIATIRLAEDGDAKVFTIENLTDFSGIKIIFGDDNFGYRLKAGDVVTFNYVETLGNSGDIGSDNIITTVETVFRNSLNNVIDMFCKNTEAISGGDDYEEIEEIRARGPKAYETKDKAVTKDDYENLIENYFSFAEKVVCWGEKEYSIDNNNPPGTFVPLEENLVHLAILSDLGENITSSQKTQIRNYLDDKKSPTDIIQFSDVEVIYLVFDVIAYISDSAYTDAAVTSNIQTVLETTYDVLNSTFKKGLYESDYVALIDNTEGVDHHNTILSYYKLHSFSSSGGPYLVDILLNVENIEPGSVEVYTKLDNEDFVLVCTDDGTGGWIPESGFSVTGTISYLIGEGNVTITSGLTQDQSRYSVKVTFNNLSEDLELTQRFQIYGYAESTITIVYMEGV
ncbi:MAG: hypothetical protein GF311_28530 [Candidatus Lokiarchaeota archaeon]|nr:hypothetical protein [Candidatus Lokiarchaeota archaeon]